MRVARIVAVAVAVALLTWIAGWWGAPLAAISAGWLWRAERGRTLTVTLGAALGWAALLALDAVQPRFGAVTAAVGGIVHVPGAVVIVVTLVFVSLLGWSAAVVGAELRRRATDAS